jgi:riboflavin synthase
VSLTNFLSIHVVHDDAKDKEFELEISWICDESNKKHKLIPLDLLEEANRLAKVGKTLRVLKAASLKSTN